MGLFSMFWQRAPFEGAFADVIRGDAGQGGRNHRRKAARVGRSFSRRDGSTTSAWLALAARPDHAALGRRARA